MDTIAQIKMSKLIREAIGTIISLRTKPYAYPHNIKYACPCSVPTPKQCRDGSAMAMALCSLCPSAIHNACFPPPINTCITGHGKKKEKADSEKTKKKQKQEKLRKT